METRLRMQRSGGEVVVEVVDLKVNSPTSGKLLDAGREFAKAKGMVLLSIQAIQPMPEERKRKRGR